MSRGLRNHVPRAFASHKGIEGYAYRRYVLAIVNRFFPGGIPADVEVLVREAGRLTVEMHATGLELEIARAKRRPNARDIARLRKAMTPMRSQLIALEQRLEERASKRPTSLAEALQQRP